MTVEQATLPPGRSRRVARIHSLRPPALSSSAVHSSSRPGAASTRCMCGHAMLSMHVTGVRVRCALACCLHSSMHAGVLPVQTAQQYLARAKAAGTVSLRASNQQGRSENVIDAAEGVAYAVGGVTYAILPFCSSLPGAR